MIFRSTDWLTAVSVDSRYFVTVVIIKEWSKGWWSWRAPYFAGSPLEAFETTGQIALLGYPGLWLLACFSINIASFLPLQHRQTIAHSADCYLHCSKIVCSHYSKTAIITTEMSLILSSHFAIVSSIAIHFHHLQSNIHSHRCCYG